MNRQSEAAGIDEVFSDNVACSVRLALDLVSAGARRFAYLHGPPSSFISRPRFAGFAAGCSRAGVSPPARIHCDFTYQGGVEATLELVERYPDLDAVAAATDSMAIGAIDALHARGGIAVPTDLMAVGHDDEAASAYGRYRLTTVRQPMEAMLREALDLVRGGSGEPTCPDGASSCAPRSCCATAPPGSRDRTGKVPHPERLDASETR